jgi:hypothetical protein
MADACSANGIENAHSQKEILRPTLFQALHARYLKFGVLRCSNYEFRV